MKRSIIVNIISLDSRLSFELTAKQVLKLKRLIKPTRQDDVKHLNIEVSISLLLCNYIKDYLQDVWKPNQLGNMKKQDLITLLAFATELRLQELCGTILDHINLLTVNHTEKELYTLLSGTHE